DIYRAAVIQETSAPGPDLQAKIEHRIMAVRITGQNSAVKPFLRTVKIPGHPSEFLPGTRRTELSGKTLPVIPAEHRIPEKILAVDQAFRAIMKRQTENTFTAALQFQERIGPSLRIIFRRTLLQPGRKIFCRIRQRSFGEPVSAYVGDVPVLVS